MNIFSANASGTVPVTIWDSACVVLFGMHASEVRIRWEQALEHEAAQPILLNELNFRMHKPLRLVCEARVNIDVGTVSGKRIFTQVHVNALDGDF